MVIASDRDHEKLIAEIYCDGKYIALLSQEVGPDELKIIFSGSELIGGALRSVGLEWFRNALKEAEKKLTNK